MPPATDWRRGHAIRYGRRRFEQTSPPPAALAHPISSNFNSQQKSNARHHPPARMIEDEGRAVAGRVHAVVMWQPIINTCF